MTTKWYLGSMNDGLFIIDQPPSPAGTDVPPGDYGRGPQMVLNVVELPTAKAKAICDAHNAAPAAPVATPFYTLRCAAGAARPVIDVMLHEDNDLHASRIAVMRAKLLHAAGYYRYSLFSPTGAHVAEFRTDDHEPTITTEKWPHGPR